MFQFTRPRGARLAWPIKSAPMSCFNSRAHAGRDAAQPGAREIKQMFQFTRPRGARHPLFDWSTRPSSFNSRAHAGRDPRWP